MRLGAFLVSSLLLVVLFAGCVQDDRDDDGDDDPGFPEFPGEPAEGPVVWGSREEAVVRPGAPMEGGCVYNWFFTDNASNAYVGAAAHCTQLSDRVRERDSGEVVGTVVFDSDESQDANEGLDFSLIRFDPDAVRKAHPAMLGFDGPSGVAAPDEVAPGDLVGFHGYGGVFGEDESTRARMGAVVDADDQQYRSNMPAVEGDSGSPVLHLDSGEALGMVSRYGLFDALDLEVPSSDVGPLVAWILVELEQAGYSLELATV